MLMDLEWLGYQTPFTLTPKSYNLNPRPRLARVPQTLRPTPHTPYPSPQLLNPKPSRRDALNTCLLPLNPKHPLTARNRLHPQP